MPNVEIKKEIVRILDNNKSGPPAADAASSGRRGSGPDWSAHEPPNLCSPGGDVQRGGGAAPGTRSGAGGVGPTGPTSGSWEAETPPTASWPGAVGGLEGTQEGSSQKRAEFFRHEKEKSLMLKRAAEPFAVERRQEGRKRPGSIKEPTKEGRKKPSRALQESRERSDWEGEMLRFLLVVVVTFILDETLFVRPSQIPSPTGSSRGKKDVTSYSEADLERLYEEWEKNDPEKGDDDDDEQIQKRKKVAIDLKEHGSEAKNPEELLKMTKRGETLMIEADLERLYEEWEENDPEKGDDDDDEQILKA
ncbi:hypothetical protein OSTOST_03732 [Ostertagia ostertagi]